MALFAAAPMAGDVVTHADLKIQGSGLELVESAVTVQLGATAVVHTRMAGLQDDAAPPANGLSAVGDLVGPGITTPVKVVTAPGHAFQVTGLSQEGVYYLQNVRLMKGADVLQLASPSVCAIQVANVLDTKVTVHQLTPEELRARGITLDPTNYDVYEYTFSFLIDGKTVQIPYPVVINKITHEVTQPPREDPYSLPGDYSQAPPRWIPPQTIGVDLLPELSPEGPPSKDPSDEPPKPKPQIHAAIVIPNSLAVLHQFFAVALIVANGAPLEAGSSVKLDSITATIEIPNRLRVAKSDPPAPFGQPVTITDPNTGATFLIAQAQGRAEWTLEGLKAGTYTIDLDVKATLRSTGQPDLPLEAKPKASIVIHDPRFSITFAHPDTIRKGLQYTTTTYVTNVSDDPQTITLSDQGLPECSKGGTVANVCRVDGYPASTTVTIPPGETRAIPYKLQSSLTGHIYATAASIDGTDSAITAAAFQLTMGVSETGVPLNPATLLLPYYARTPYFSDSFLDAQLGYLGVAYSLATAPLTKQTARFPRLVPSDVFTRAIDLARAGERMFIGEDSRASLSTMTLDALGNSVPLAEWDQFLRQQLVDPAGIPARDAMTAFGAELSTAFGKADGTFNDMADRFAGSTTDRGPYVFALVHASKGGAAAQPFAVKIENASGQTLAGAPGDGGGWKRDLAWGQIFPLDATGEGGTLAVLGRSNEALDLTVTPAAGGSATLDLIFPAADGVRLVRASATFNATANQPVHIHIEHGAVTGDGGISFSPRTIDLAPLAITGARQDLNLDPDGHVVSVLFNRRLAPDAADQSSKFDTDVSLDTQKFNVTFNGKRVVAGAAQQQDLRIIRLNYENGLSNDAQYLIHVNGILDAGVSNTVRPIVEDRSSALVYGTVLRGDNTLVSGATIQLNTATGTQWGTTDQDGHVLFEYVPRDPDNGISGGYVLNATAEGKQTRLEGAVRLLHTLHKISVVFLGRGSAQGIVRYDNGTPVANARVVVGSTMFNQMRSATTNTDGSYSVGDVPVGPLTFSALDTAGNVAYAANELRAGGQVLLQDITIYRKQFPGIGAVRGKIYRSDTNKPAANVHVGVSSQGFGLTDGVTDNNGAFYFAKVPAGFVTVLGADFTIAPLAIAVDFDLQAGETHDVGTLYLAVPTGNTQLATLEGNVTAERALQPGTFDPVPNAQVQMEGMPLILADPSGHYVYNAVPLSASGRKIQAIDPVTRRGKRIDVPSLDPPTPEKPSNNLPINITNDSGLGTGTIRVHLVSQSGVPVDGYHVFEPGFPTLESVPGGAPGVYEFNNLPVGRSLLVLAAPSGISDPVYGYQTADGRASVSYAGQIAAVTLRLPGQGTLSAHIEQQTEAGVNVRLIGRVNITFRHWSDEDQEMRPITLKGSTDNASDAVFRLVPVRQSVLVETADMAGYAFTTQSMPYDGSVVPVTLTLGTLSEVRGHVFGADGYTPVAGAKVHVVDNAQDLGYSITGVDGSFVQKNVVPGSSFTVTADYTQNNIYRTALASGSTPADGRPAEVTLILMKQGSVDGSVVDANNNPIQFARIWLRELSYPSRQFGFDEPLYADAAGHFRFNNIFTVGVRMTALDPNNPDSRGDWSGVVTDEAAVAHATIVVGSSGTGSLRVTVRDPNSGFAPVPNAEVAVYKGQNVFDFGTTDGSGVVQFDQLPVGNYGVISAYSKSLGRSGSIASFSIARNLTTAFNIDLEFSGEVKGTLTDPQAGNAPVPATSVTLYGGIYSTRTTSDTAGAFDFLGIREGNFSLEARDPKSIRMARATGSISTANPTFITPLTLEPTSTLTVKAFLPNDTGGSSGVLAPLVTIDVQQGAPGGTYLRTSQTNGAQFPGLLRNRPGAVVPFHVEIHEVGGLGRRIALDDSFAADAAAKEIDVTFVAFGTVEVTVVKSDPPVPAADVFVTASGNGGGRSAYTDASGVVTLGGIPLGNVTVQAKNTSGSPLTGAASLTLGSQTQTAKVTIQLGSYSSITGTVLAEGGAPSAGTRVLAQYSPTGGSSIQLETRTDSTGSYTFLGIATQVSGTSVTLTYLGLDDVTIGARQSVAVANGAGTVTAPTVTLDSTPPQLQGVFPADGTTKVAPDTKLKFTFNRQLRPDQLTSSYFQLWDSSTNQQLALTLSGDPVIQDNRSEVITFAAPAPPAGQRYPLKSNTLYRIVVSGHLQDLAGHELGPDLGTSFTTSDYSAPQVVKVTPPPSQPLPKNGYRLGVTFSKPLDKTPWQSGGNGVMQFVQINGLGGQVIGVPVPGQIQLDPTTSATLYFAPDIELPPSSYYRLSLSGVVDTDGRAMIDASGNTLSVFTQDFFTYDNGAPVVAINNPKLNGTTEIGAADPLYNNASYTIGVTLTNADGSAVTDLSDVKFYTVDPVDGTLTQIRNATATSVVITPPPGGTSFKLRADATDLSGNKGTATRTWSVSTQAPLVINSTAVTPSSVYPAKAVTDTVKLGGGGLEATVTVTATVKGTAIAPVSASAHITRAAFTDPWPDAVIAVTIPATAPAGALVDVTASATDLRGGSAPPKTDTVTVAADANAPASQPLTIEVVTSSVSGRPSNVFNNGDSYRVHAFASDAESGVASVTFVVENAVYAPIKAGDPGSTLRANGVWEFVSPIVTVRAHNDDTAVDISAKALDNAGNASSASATVTYNGIHDPNAPAVAWIAPLHDAAWPAATADFTTRLRVYAASPVTLVGSFDVPGLGTLQATRSGTELYADIAAANHFTTPAAGTKLTITAHVQDDTGGHKVDLTTTVDVVAVGQTVPQSATLGVDDSHPLLSDSVYVDGGHLVLHIPVSLKNLIVLHGGSVESARSTTANEQRLDLTVADHLYVDDASSVDVSARGYVGGLAANADNSGNNPSAAGRTRGNVDGATSGASGSYAGIGGDDAGATNAPYGSIAAPNDLGSGGAADTSNRAGGQGGGAAYIHTTADGLGNVVVAGKMLADGESGTNRGGAGSGGSIHVAANQVVLGAASTVSANGGDDDGSTSQTRAGGGGRVSIEAAALLDVDSTTGAHLSARGGRNTAADSAVVLDGGAGTIFLRNAGEAYGELLVSSLDARYSDPHHLTRATPLGGTLVFDKVTLGPRALVRADAALTIAGVQNDKTKAGIDASAVLLLPDDLPTLTLTAAPPAPATLGQGSVIAVTYTATSKAGIGGVTYSLAPSVVSRTDAFGYPATATQPSNAALTIPANAPVGDATFTARATDRAGRTADAPSGTYTITLNQAPVLTGFTLDAPTPLYIGGSFTAAVSATDDAAVKTLTLTAQIGSDTIFDSFVSPNASPASNTFTVPVPRQAGYDAQTITVTAKASDGVAAPVTSQKTLTLAHDGTKPVITITDPNAGTVPYLVADQATKKIHVVATVIDAESGVKAGTISASLQGGESKGMSATGNPNQYAADLSIPTVTGSATVTRTVTVTASDVVGNVQSAVAPVQITPIYDATAPILTWNCGSDGAIVAAGTSLPLSVTVVPGATGTAIDKSTITYDFGDGNGPHAVAESPIGSNAYPYTYNVPAGATGTIAITVSGKSIGGGTGTLFSTVTVATFDKTVSADTTIQANDTTNYDGKDVVVTGGALTINGTHTFRKLVVLGGTVVPKSADLLHPDTITVGTLYVACGASIDASSYSGAIVGFPRNATYPGAGMAIFDSGGGHIGRGGAFVGRSFQPGAPGGTYGSVYRPLEPGSGGQDHDPANATYAGSAGGGVVRLVATNLLVDGSILANGQESATFGEGAGGSVYITTGSIGGGGQIQAKGANWQGSASDSAAGGGGAIAIEYTSASGTILNRLTATSGSNTPAPAAAGSVYLFGPGATYGNLTVDNGSTTTSLPANVLTELPSFGIANVLSATSANVAVVDAMWEPSYLAGNWLQVTGADGVVRGKWRIASVANDASVRTVNGAVAVPSQNVAVDTGYLMYSDLGYPVGGQTAHIVPVRNNGAGWQYDNGVAFMPFAPASGDVLFATFSATTAAITSVQKLACPSAVCTPVSGIPTAAVLRGDIMMNAANGTWLSVPTPTYAPVYGAHSFLIHPDPDAHGFVLSGGPVTVTLESGADARAGDVVRGVYRFDNLTVKNARLYTPDLVDLGGKSPTLTNSTYVPGNAGAPVVTATGKISVRPGFHGPAVTGTAGAAVDADGAELYVRNTTRPPQTISWTNNLDVTFGTNGGFSIRKVPNGGDWGAYAHTATGSTAYGYIEGRVSQTDKQLDILLTSNAVEGGEYDWAILPGGSCQIWLNGQQSGSTFSYNANSLFRIERTPDTVYFYLDGALMKTAPVDSRPRYGEVAFRHDSAEVNSIDFAADPPARFSAVAAGDGSFSVPVYGVAGDALTLTARDRHAYPMTSAPLSIGTIPATAVIAAPTLSPSPATGGHTVTGTVTLGSAAPAGGTEIFLSSSSTLATVPAKVTIPSGATFATFNVTTQVVTGPQSVTITAYYGGVAYTTTLSLVVDNIAPAVTLTSPPATPTQSYLEGSGQITVQATATDADSGLAGVVASIDGVQYPMTAPNGSSVYSTTITAPFIDGTTPVTKQLTVTATDRQGNSTPASVNVVINPSTDSTPPTVAWSCLTSGAMLPTAYTTKLRVTATGSSSSNVVSSVTFAIDGGAPITANAIGNNLYEASWATPSAAKTVTIVATATAAGGGSKTATTTVSVVAPDVSLSGTQSISATNTQYDGKVVAVTGTNTVVTIDGQHNFAKLMVLDGASVVETSGVTNPLSLGATGSLTDVYVGCTASIDVSGKGYGWYAPNTTATPYGDGNGGSHIGYGGINSGVSVPTYGSVYRPQEPGSGAGNGGTGGGVLRIQSASITVDGTISAKGTEAGNNTNRTGAGGSIWITTGKIAGSGKIDAGSNNASGYGSGGGGAIAIEYTDAASTLPALASIAGTSARSQVGGGGSIYVKGPGATYGDLTVDNGGQAGQPTILPSLGTGLAQSGSAGNTLVTDRTANIPTSFIGNWVRITGADGTIKGTWRVDGVNAKSVTLAPNAAETVNVAVGDTWQGVYQFDTLTLRGIRLESGNDLIVSGTEVIASGTVEHELLDVTNLRVAAGATLTHRGGLQLSIAAKSEVRVEATGAIDASARGLGNYAPNTTATPYGDGNGGSHMGVGGVNQNPPVPTFGSVYQPQEAGTGGGNGGTGGGIVHILAATVVVDGSILAKGTDAGNNTNRTGAGGSIWIQTGKISGSGKIDTGSTDASGYGSGGGGAISIVYTDPASTLPALSNYAGASARSQIGGAGTTYVKGPSSTYGDLTVDNNAQSGQPTVLPSLGTGTAQSGSGGNTLVTDRAANIPTYFIGNWVRVKSAGGTVKGTWRIKGVNAKTVTLTPNANETIDVAQGDTWQGAYQFDSLTLRGVRLESGSDLVVAGTEVIGSGTVEHEALNATSLRIASGATLTHRAGSQLSIVAQSEVRIDAGGAIDVSGKGTGYYAPNTQATPYGDGNGGSHMGVGGVNQNPPVPTFGSVYTPQEAGMGGGNGGTGGGIVRIQAPTVVVDGNISVAGTSAGNNTNRSGSGGSVWILAGKISGAGTIDAGSANASGYGSGGGGAISIVYTDPASTLPALSNYAGTSGRSQVGGAGTIYIKGPSSTYGDLTLDDHGQTGMATSLPSLGSGIAQPGTGGTTLVTDRASDIPAYFIGNWVRVFAGDGTVKGTWRISGVNARTVTLAPNGNEVIAIAASDKWQGAYQFDTVTLKGVRLESGSDLVLAGTETLASGTVEHDSIVAGTVRIASGATLTNRVGSSVSVTAQNDLRIETGAAIDMNGRGYGQWTSYTGTISFGDGNGGSHMGVGGVNQNPAAPTFGSVYRPQELGAGGGTGGTGGGAVRIQAATVLVDGSILARGTDAGSNTNRTGAGGSVWITTGKISGAGKIDTGSADATGYGSGGGGAIAIEYTDATSTLPALSNIAGTSGRSQVGGPGTIYTKGPGATYGDLTVDNLGRSGQSTILPGLGFGSAQPGSGGTVLVTDRATNIEAYHTGRWVEITDSANNLKGRWRILSIDAVNGKKVTLQPNAGETIDVQQGDTWRGLYLFDNVKINGAALKVERIVSTNTPQLLNGGTISGNNTGAPLVTASKIQLVSTVAADTVVGTQGAVYDIDTPVVVTATNTRTAQTFTATAAADGSFSIPVSGVPGDAFTVYATDSNLFPATSAAIGAGQIVNTNGVSAITVQPQSVTAGGQALFGVRLLGAARYPITVTLASSDASVPVPASLVVPIGTSSTTFTVTTVTPAAQVTATITATGPTASASTTLTVIPSGATLASISLASSSVQGGTSVDGTVTLAAPAPAGGALVSLSSSNPSVASVSSPVTVPQGDTTRHFTVTTVQAAASSAVTITGIYGATQSAPLTVTACSSMQTPATPAAPSLDQLWVDDGLPTGAASSGAGSFVSGQAATGTQSIQIPAASGARQFSFSGATATMSTGANDKLVAYVLINPCNPPRQILLAWSDASTDYRASWGEDLIETTTAHTRMGSLPRTGEWVRLETPASTISAAGKTLKGLTIKMYDGEAWFDTIGRVSCSLSNPPVQSFLPVENVWFDDAPPSGATMFAQGPSSAWVFDTAQHASGTNSHKEPAFTGFHQHSFQNAATTMTVNPGDVLFAYVLIDPCNPPRQVILQWSTDNTNWSRAFWGDALATGGTYGTSSFYRMGSVPDAGGWVRLEVPAQLMGLEQRTVVGMAFSLYDGQAWFDRAGKYARVNLALGKTATQSSNFSAQTTADRAVDGNTSGDAVNTTSVAITNGQAQPWWQVDLGASQPIENIELWNRTDCCSSRLNTFWLFVSDTPFSSTDLNTTRNQAGVGAYRYDGQVGGNVMFNVNRTGRYVRVQLTNADVLQLAEVQVWAPGAPQKVNVAGGLSTAAAQSSTFGGYAVADRAVNGTTQQHWNDGSIQHTNFDTNAWWEVDLGSSQPISSIDIYNRLDCCPERLQNFYVFVSDAPFTSHVLTDAINKSGVYNVYFASGTHSGWNIPINRTGRYVRVQLGGSNYLHMAEVQVWSSTSTVAPLGTHPPGEPAATGAPPAPPPDGGGDADDVDLLDGASDELLFLLQPATESRIERTYR